MTNHQESMPATTPGAGEPVETAMVLVASLCGSGTCPTIYRTDRGTVVIQGAVVMAAGAGLDLPEGEALVEVPEEFLVSALAEISARRAA
jgi:hypothetical protein